MNRNHRFDRRAIPSVDHIVETRYDAATELVRELRQRPGVSTPDHIVDHLVRRYSRDLATAAAWSGGVAAVPAVGTAAGLLVASADLARTISKLGEMVLAIGVAYGHDEASFEDRKAWLVAVLSMGRGAAVGVEGLAGRVGAGGGSRLAGTIATGALRPGHSKLASGALTRLSTEQAAARLGRLLPFGIGAGVGAAGTVMIVRSVARSARQYFSQQHPTAGRRPHPGSIEVAAIEVDPPPPEARVQFDAVDEVPAK